MTPPMLLSGIVLQLYAMNLSAVLVIMQARLAMSTVLHILCKYDIFAPLYSRVLHNYDNLARVPTLRTCSPDL